MTDQEFNSAFSDAPVSEDARNRASRFFSEESAHGIAIVGAKWVKDRGFVHFTGTRGVQKLCHTELAAGASS